MSDKTIYQAEFEQFVQNRKGQEPDWMLDIRKLAYRRFAEPGLPTHKHEDWKYTSPKSFTEVPFAQASNPNTNVDKNRLQDAIGDLPPQRAVFVDGHFQPTLSELKTLPAGVQLSSITQALKAGDETLKTQLQRHLDRSDIRTFDALNLAFFTDGLFLQLPKNTKLEQPIEVVYYATGETNATTQQLRNVILAAPGSESTLTEIYTGADEALYWTNSCSEFDVATNAHLTHIRIQEEGSDARHIANLHAHLGASCNFASHVISFGGKIVRNDAEAVLSAEGIECTLNGLYLALDDQHVDNRTFLDHAKPHCNSYELYKGVLDQRGKGVFNGKILVRQDAQKTDAKQSNQALLLSDDASIYSKPQLEIFADDVKCTHGATSGNLDPEAMFYLQSRGLSEQKARALLTFAFANELITQLPHQGLSERLEQALTRHLNFV